MSFQNVEFVNNICKKSCGLHKKIDKMIDKIKEQLIIEVEKRYQEKEDQRPYLRNESAAPEFPWTRSL